MQVIEGNLVAPASARIALVAARFNEFVVKELIAGAREALLRHGLPESQIVLVRVPGAWEIPAGCRRLAATGRFDAIVALGAVIRGGTAHFDYVASGVANGVANVTATTGVPVALGVLTTDTIEQAIERSGSKAGNKGHDAALAALEMINVGNALTEAGY